MITLEDRELEEMVLSGNSCIAVPIEIYIPTNDEAQITVYSSFAKIAEEFVREFGDDLFNANALNWLDSKLYASVKEFGYTHFFDDIHMLSEYSMTDISQLNTSSSDDVKIINTEYELRGLNTELIDEISIDDVAAVVIKSGKVVSIACVNDISFDDNGVEIFVETDVSYRNSGFGFATVSLLAKHYLEKGIPAHYKCAKNNEASIRLAEKCGFKKNGERFSYVCYSSDEE